MTTGAVKGMRGGMFCPYVSVGDELDREGARCGHATCMGVPVHSAYMAQS
jgi:hypothetical protein